MLGRLKEAKRAKLGTVPGTWSLKWGEEGPEPRSPSFYLCILRSPSLVEGLLPACRRAEIKEMRDRGESVAKMRAGAASLLPSLPLFFIFCLKRAYFCILVLSEQVATVQLPWQTEEPAHSSPGPELSRWPASGWAGAWKQDRVGEGRRPRWGEQGGRSDPESKRKG